MALPRAAERRARRAGRGRRPRAGRSSVTVTSRRRRAVERTLQARPGLARPTDSTARRLAPIDDRRPRASSASSSGQREQRAVRRQHRAAAASHRRPSPARAADGRQREQHEARDGISGIAASGGDRRRHADLAQDLRRRSRRRDTPSISASGWRPTRWRNAAGASALTSSGITKSRPCADGARLRARQQRDRRARRRAEVERAVAARPPDDVGDVLEQAVVDAHAADRRLHRHQLLGRGHAVRGPCGRGALASKPGQVVREDRLLDRGARVAHVQLEQEAIELRLGQRVGALRFDRVLRGDDEERLGQRAG